MKNDNGFSLIELLAVVAIITVLASVSIMSVMRSRAAANESSAIGSIRTIASAQIAYSASCGRGGFAADLPTLGVAPPGSPLPYLPPDMTGAATIQKSGYRFVVAPSVAAVAGGADCNGTATESGYYVTGIPATYGNTGNRSFAMATPNLTIWHVYAAAAPAEPFAAPAVPLP